MPRLLSLSRVACLAMAAAILSWMLLVPEAHAEAPASASPGGPVPQISLPLLLPSTVDFEDRVLGEWEAGKTRVLVYGLAAHANSKLELESAVRIAGDLPGDVVVAAVMPPKRGLKSADDFRRALAGDGFELPVFRDDGFALGRVLGLGSAPAIVVLTADGRLAVVGARSFAQPTGSGSSVESVLREGLATGTIEVVTELATFDESHRLLGRPFMDGVAERMGTGERVALSDRVGVDGRALLLVFWSVRCPHCTRELPRYATVTERFADRLDVLTIARASDEAFEKETASYIEAKGLDLPVLFDRERKLAEAYLVRSTPTLVLVDAAGTIRGVQIGDVADLDSWLEARL